MTFTPSPWRIIDPPQKVMIAAHLAIATKPKHFRQDTLAMRVKLGGLRLGESVPGWLHAWVLLSSLHFVNAVLRECVLFVGIGSHPTAAWRRTTSLS